MGDSSGKAKSSGSSKAGMQKKQGQEEANQVLQDLGYRTEGQKVFSDKGQVAGKGWSGSRTVDAVRDAAYQVGLEPGGLGKSVRGTRSPLEVRQLSAITGLPIEDVRAQAENVSEIYGRPAEVRLEIDKFGNPMAYGAAAPTLSELGGDIKRAITGGTYGSVMRGEPAPENYQGIAGPLANLILPGGMVRNMLSNIYGEGKEFVTGPIDYTKNLFSGIFSPSATQTAEMNPQTRNFLQTFQAPERNRDSGAEQIVEEITEEAPVTEQVPYLAGYDPNTLAPIVYSNLGGTLVPYEDLINNRLIV
jgi:hypothetical protein